MTCERRAVRSRFVVVCAGTLPLLQVAIPSDGHRLSEEPALLAEVGAETMQVLELDG
jgi:hypothetical protein